MDLPTITELLKSGGVGALILVFWWLERRERVELQKNKDALLERTLGTLHSVSNSLDALASSLKVRGGL